MALITEPVSSPFLKAEYSETGPGNLDRAATIFQKARRPDKINLQRDGSKAKVYQVRQERRIILTYGLGGVP